MTKSAAKLAIVESLSALLRGEKPEADLGDLLETFPRPSDEERLILDEIPPALRKAAEKKNGSGMMDVLALLGNWSDPETPLDSGEIINGLREVSRTGSYFLETFAELQTAKRHKKSVRNGK